MFTDIYDKIFTKSIFIIIIFINKIYHKFYLLLYNLLIFYDYYELYILYFIHYTFLIKNFRIKL